MNKKLDLNGKLFNIFDSLDTILVYNIELSLEYEFIDKLHSPIYNLLEYYLITHLQLRLKKDLDAKTK